jgi:hypothetical protein
VGGGDKGSRSPVTRLVNNVVPVGCSGVQMRGGVGWGRRWPVDAEVLAAALWTRTVAVGFVRGPSWHGASLRARKLLEEGSMMALEAQWCGTR